MLGSMSQSEQERLTGAEVMIRGWIFEYEIRQRCEARITWLNLNYLS